MNKRNEMARTCQNGASSRSRVARALHEAIEECNAEGVSTEEDPAVFLILHQLTYLLIGYDFACSERLDSRWRQAMKLVGEQQ